MGDDPSCVKNGVSMPLGWGVGSDGRYQDLGSEGPVDGSVSRCCICIRDLVSYTCMCNILKLYCVDLSASCR